ncbi:hypothetical protein KDA_37480 [Dictyobacter alpinus]|uniref:Protein kinase domain-containing protein n=1 Tax=Dictyobacter alpinus TaxID=2014873 RepID=A0A402BA55_9CHLR|nr:serine/threonine-protein kinase [Dictyobacter alpinus]GCE28264.1 hypothetical protein KDA_37480 [Dictyobacter alpinus]
MVFQIGQEIGNYRIVSEIAQGAYAYVYKASHTTLSQRIVAIKILHRTFVDPEAKHDILYQEAHILEQLQHPHILAVIDFGSYENAPYIVKEFAPHGSLRDYLQHKRNRPLPINEVLFLIRQIGEGLQFAHDHNIVHCDLKPENILFNAEDQALISDFDIARVLKSTSAQGKNIGGTPSYMAPEQFHGKVRRESDQYALACMAYEMLTGRRPFEGDDVKSLQQQHLHEPPVPPTQLRPDLPLHIEQALLRALDKEYQDRYPDVATFVAAIDPVQTTGVSGAEWPTAALVQQRGPRLVLHAPGKAGKQDENIFYEDTISMHSEATVAEVDLPAPRKRRATTTKKPAIGEKAVRPARSRTSASTAKAAPTRPTKPRTASAAASSTARPKVSRARTTEKDAPKAAVPRKKATTPKTTTAKKPAVKKPKTQEGAATAASKPKAVRTKPAAEKKPAVARKPATGKKADSVAQTPAEPRSMPAWQQAVAHQRARSTNKNNQP